MFVYEAKFRADAPAGLFLSRKGNWFHDGDLLEHQRICALLHRSIARDQNELMVTTGRDRLAFIAEDAPFLVKKIEIFSNENSSEPTSKKSFSKKIILQLSDETYEELSAQHSFRTTEEGAIFISVKDNVFWARLTSGAQQKVQPFLEFDESTQSYFWVFDQQPIVLSRQKWRLIQVEGFIATARPAR